jgi:hypothetical protein
MKRAEAFISATARALACASALVCAQGFAAGANSVAAREPQSVMVAQAATPEPAPTTTDTTKKGGRRRFVPGSFVVLVVGE